MLLRAAFIIGLIAGGYFFGSRPGPSHSSTNGWRTSCRTLPGPHQFELYTLTSRDRQCLWGPMANIVCQIVTISPHSLSHFITLPGAWGYCETSIFYSPRRPGREADGRHHWSHTARTNYLLKDIRDLSLISCSTRESLFDLVKSRRVAKSRCKDHHTFRSGG